MALDLSKHIHKALRFGLEDVNCLDPNGPNNRERIVDELNDLMGVIRLAVDAHIIPPGREDEHAQIRKKLKVRKFMAYAKSKGSLDE